MRLFRTILLTLSLTVAVFSAIANFPSTPSDAPIPGVCPPFCDK